MTGHLTITGRQWRYRTTGNADANGWQNNPLITGMAEKDWNGMFRLQAPYNTTVQGTIENGAVKEFKVMPDYRAKDVIIGKD